MNSISNRDGLSARRRAIDKVRENISRIRFLMKRGAVLSLITGASLLISSCHEKTNGQDSAYLKNRHSSVAKDSLNKPKVNIKVNKRYDDKGNLIGFDSTYSSYYSNVRGDTSKMDSLMNSFDRYFDHNHSLLFDNQFNSLFFKDSTRYPDFFHHDFFMKRYELNDAYLKGMMHRMDSIKNDFFKEHSRKGKDPNDL